MFINVMILGIAFQLILNLTRPAVPLFASSLGASTLEIGVLTACYAFLPMFSLFPQAKWPTVSATASRFWPE